MANEFQVGNTIVSSTNSAALAHYGEVVVVTKVKCTQLKHCVHKTRGHCSGYSGKVLDLRTFKVLYGHWCLGNSILYRSLPDSKLIEYE